MESVFFKVVDLLNVVNDLQKRGHQSNVLSDKFVDSLIFGAVEHYNREFGIKPQSQPKPDQIQTPSPVRREEVQAQPRPEMRKQQAPQAPAPLPPFDGEEF